MDDKKDWLEEGTVESESLAETEALDEVVGRPVGPGEMESGK